MKKIIIIISIALAFNISCQTYDRGQVEVTLSHEIIEHSHLLVMTFKNTCLTPVYIPKLASIELSIDSIRFINSEGETINEQLVDNELTHGISFYGPPINGKTITDYCSDNPNIFEEIDLDLPPFNERKEMVRSIIQYEYETLISTKSPRMLTEEDVRFIKSLIFSKYCNSIFLKPGEIYRDCVTINTLFKKNETYTVFLHYTPSTKIERYMYHFKFGRDSMEINSNLLDVYKGYGFYNGNLKSDTLTIN